MAAIADNTDTLTFCDDTTVHVCDDIEHDAVPTCMAICDGNTTLIKLENCSLFLIVSTIVYVVIAFTSAMVGVTATLYSAPAVHQMGVVVRVSIA